MRKILKWIFKEEWEKLEEEIRQYSLEEHLKILEDLMYKKALNTLGYELVYNPLAHHIAKGEKAMPANYYGWKIIKIFPTKEN